MSILISSFCQILLSGLEDVRDLRCVVFYEAGGDGGEVGPVPSVAIADSLNLSVYRIRCVQSVCETVLSVAFLDPLSLMSAVHRAISKKLSSLRWQTCRISVSIASYQV